MRYRRFGSTQLETSEVGVGCARIGGVFQRSSRSDTVALLRHALDCGITFFDTADMYTQGESERIVGEAFEGRRDHVIIATKVGYRLPTSKRFISRVKPLVRPFVSRLRVQARQVHASLRGTVAEQDFSAEQIIRAAEASLRRLRTDYIDVYQLHDPPPDVLARGDFIAPLEQLRKQGKIRYWGVACKQPEDALISFQHASLDSVQVGLSVLEQAALDAAIPGAAERGVAVIARQVFASGLVTRPLDRLHLGDIDTEAAVARRKRDQLSRYASIAEDSGRSRAEMALQFNLARTDVSVVLLGVSRLDQLKEGLRGAEAPALSREEERLLLASRRPGR